jgi:hypothetical protein
VLLETLEARAKEFGEGHKQVLDAAKGLQAAYGKSASEVNQKLDELSQAASKLWAPGRTKVGLHSPMML